MWPFRKKKGKAKMRPRPRFVKICPRCQSINVQVSHQGGLSGLTAIGLPTMYRCNKCGFTSYSFPEINLNETKEFKDNIEEEKDASS